MNYRFLFALEEAGCRPTMIHCCLLQQRNKTARGTAFRYWKDARAMGSDDAHNWYDPRQTECAVSVGVC